jgi:hypothetical protein
MDLPLVSTKSEQRFSKIKTGFEKYTGVTYVVKARVFPLPKSGKRVTRMVKKRIG